MTNHECLSDSSNGIIIPGDEKKMEGDNPLSGSFGETFIKKIDFSGVRLLYGKLKFIRPVPVQVINDSPYIEMYFSLAGSRDVYFTQSSHRSSVGAGYHNLFYIPDSNFYIEPSATEEESISVQIQFTEAYFRRFMPEEHSLLSAFLKKMDDKEFSVLSFGHLRITGEMYAILNDIVQCEKEGIIRQLYIETNVLKLLLLQFEQCGAVTGINEGNGVKQYDIEKYDLVKKLLEDNIAYGHSLGELSRKSGLNDFKLKKGFKELYGTTVFGYLHELRMTKAKEILRESERSVAEIAECCGYAYVQSFSTAFKSRYGITPEKFRKKERLPQ